MTGLDIGLLAKPFTHINFWGIGAELLPLAFATFLAVAISKKKSDFVKTFLLAYTVTFLVGWATALWVLIILAFLGALYFTQLKEGE